MNLKRLMVGLIGIGIVLSNVDRIHAQDSLVCDQNRAYWERWQANAELRARMTGSMWNGTSFDLSPDGATMAVVNSDTLALFDVQTLTPTVELNTVGAVQGGNYGGTYQAVDWSPDGKRIAAAYEVFGNPEKLNPVSGIQIWGVEQNEQIALFAGRPKAINWSPDSSMLAEADGLSGDIWLWDTERRLSSTLNERDFGSPIMDKVLWSPDGHYLAVESGYEIVLYQLGKDEPQFLESPEKDIDYIVWSPGSKQIVMGNELALNLFFFDVSTGELTRTLNGGDGNPLDLQWSPDGAWLARGTQRGLFLWDMTRDDTTPARSFAEHMPPFVRMAWTPDSQGIISVDFEGSLYRWDVATGCVEAAYLKDWTPGS